MLDDAKAKYLVFSAVNSCLGPENRLSVETAGFKPWSRKAATAKCLGPGGRVFQLKVSGWGPAYQVMEVLGHVAFDLNGDPQHIAGSIVTQASAIISMQTRLRTAAHALGIEEPLDRSRFLDTRRLRIDRATAEAYVDAAGSRREATERLRMEMEKAFEQTSDYRVVSGIHMSGTEARIQFLLDPLRPTACTGYIDPRPVWTGQEMCFRARRGANALPDAIASRAESLLQNTPVRNREIVDMHIVPRLREVGELKPGGSSTRTIRSRGMTYLVRRERTTCSV